MKPQKARFNKEKRVIFMSKGEKNEATLVCVCGNRAYEDTLAEMEDAAKKILLDGEECVVDL